MPEDQKDRKDPRPRSQDIVAAPRDLSPPDDADGVTRVIANDPADDANPRATQRGHEDVEEEIEEKVVEGGVAAANAKAETEWELTPHSI